MKVVGDTPDTKDRQGILHPCCFVIFSCRFGFDSDTARLWTSLTAQAVGADAVAALPATVPDHAYFPLYGPDFRIATREKTLTDKNDDVFLGR